MNQQFSIPIVSGAPDTYTIIAYLDDFIIRFGQMPEVRQAAIDIIGDAGNHDQRRQAAALLGFVRYRVRFTLDPIGSEFIISPLRMLADIRRRGFAYGDCDDHVLLLGSLAASLGIPSRAVGVYISGASKRFDHVINLMELNGSDELMDSCRKQQTANQPRYSRLLISGHA